MLKGHNLVGFTESAAGTEVVSAFSTVDQRELPEKFAVATATEVENAVKKAVAAFAVYKTFSPDQKATFLETIAEEIIALGDGLIKRAMLETGLPEARLTGERGRTTGQLKLFADLLREGSWVEAVIDSALPDRKPLPRADLRKMLVPIGPVAVFGASNFPFAFSTAGGDTASALAAGNPVIVKAHPSHLGTNELIASAIDAAAKKCDMPDGIFSFIISKGNATSIQLVTHPGIKAVGFTGSFNGGMAIYQAAITDRAVPIPVYAEMSSINPVVLLPGKLKQDAATVATQLSASITLGAGQFCTNPGLIFLLQDDATTAFVTTLTESLTQVAPATMLNPGIATNYYEGRKQVAANGTVSTLFMGDELGATHQATPALLQVPAADFIANDKLQQEVFGPASILVICKDAAELNKALSCLHGQLTGSIYGLAPDLTTFSEAIDILSGKVGRVLFNGVPTGVEVCHAMVHGGPFPSTTDARSTSVGADAIKRFVRPLCFQDCPETLLPAELKNNNPFRIMRKVNGQYTHEGL
ncbi:MAG: aldehyde dehydrogenase (NADP(+)) [Bacteroidota bacterium]